MAGQLKVDSINADSNLTLRIANTAVAFIDSNGLRPSSGNVSLDATGTTGVRSPAANTLVFYEGGVEAVRIDSSGNMGVGTASPAARLDVRTTSSTQATFTRTGQTAVCTLFQSSADTYLSATNSGASLILATQDTERGRFDSSGNFLFNSGYGSVATAYGCRAWANFNGLGTVAIRASGGFSSITDVSTGTYELNFTTSMPDTNYAVSISLKPYADSKERPELDNLATNNVRVVNDDGMNNYQDTNLFTVAVFR